MNTQLLVGWIAILLPLAATSAILFLPTRSAGENPVGYRRTAIDLIAGTTMLHAMVWFVTMFVWVFAILIDLEWLPDRYFVWMFDALLAPWRSLLG